MALTSQLPYRKPALTNPITINIPNPVTSAFPALTAGQDYILVLPTGAPLHVAPTASAAIPINGGRNVWVIGGEIEFIAQNLVPTENAGDGTTTQCGRVCIVQNNTGVVHLEGIWAHGPGLVEAPNVYSDLTTLQIENCRFGDATYPIQNTKIGLSTGPVANDHPDGVAFIERCANVNISRVDTTTAYQGFFLKNVGGEAHPAAVNISDTSIICSDVTGLEDSCTKWLGIQATGTLRDVMAAYSQQTTAQTQSHSATYQQTASWCAALATYKCDAFPDLVKTLGSATNSTNNTTIATTTTGTVAAGNTIFAVFGHRGSGITMSSVAGGSLTWSIDVTLNDAPNFFGVTIARANCPSGLASGTTITGTLTGANVNKEIMLGEFSGVKASSPLDKTTTGVLDAVFTQGFTIPPTAKTTTDVQLVMSAWMAGFTAGGTLIPGSGTTPTSAEQVIWNTQGATRIPVNLSNVWVTLAQGSSGLDHHVWPDQSQGAVAPTTAGDGSVSWPASTGYSGKVNLGPTSDMTLAGGSVRGPGRLYSSPGYVGDVDHTEFTPLVYLSPTDPTGVLAAPPGTTVIKTDGKVYTKVSGKGTAGWRETQ